MIEYKKTFLGINSSKNTKYKFILPLFLTAAVFVGTNTMSYAQNEPQETVTLSKAQDDLRMAMRKLWEDHITYTRNYIISALSDLEDTSAVSERLLKNQDDIGQAISTYYGDEAGKKL